MSNNIKGGYSYKTLLSIAFPIILGNLAQTIITLTDTAFLGRLSENALSASLMTGIFYYIFTTLAWGFCIGVQVMIARRLGEEKYGRIGVIFQHGVMLLLPLSWVLLAVMHFFSDPILAIVIKSPNIYGYATEYFSYRHYGILFVCFNYLFRSLYVGLSNTKPITYTTLVMAVVNIFFDYSLIFGKFGMPEMGVAGAAIASVIAEFSALVFFIVYTVLAIDIKKYALFTIHKVEMWLAKLLVNLSLPTMMQKLFSIGVWFVFFILIEHMGERPIAVTGVIRSVYMLVSIPAFAFGVVSNTLTSRLIGEHRRDQLNSMLFKIIKLSMMCMAPVLILCVICPEALLSIYTDDMSLISDSLGALYMICFGVLFLSSGVVYFEAISGLGQTLHAMLLEAAILIIYLVHTWLLSSYFVVDIEWVWSSEALYWSLLGLFSYVYIRSRKNSGERVF